MFKQWFNRLTRIASGTFGSTKEDGLSLEASLTKFERFFHFWVLVGRSFVRNRCPVRASALSYTTLLALIPVLAVAMSITSAILKSEGEERIKHFIEQFVDNMVPETRAPEPLPAAAVPVESDPVANLALITSEASNRLEAIQMDASRARAENARQEAAPTNATPVLLTAGTEEETSPATNHTEAATAAGVVQVKKNVAREAANYIYDFAKKSYSGTLGATGMVFLILTAIMTLTRVEETFNDIWGVTHGRDWWSRVANYTMTIAFGPVFLLVALGMMNGPNFQKSRDIIRMVPFLEPVLTSILPLLIICFTFALFYKLVPNTKVDFGAAFVGGSLAGLGWHGYNQLGWLLASRAVSASAVYGSLFIIPLLMGGLYVVWLTVLFGAQVAYAFQNRASYLQDRLVENVNQRGREFVALRLMTCIGQRFHRGLPPATIREISVELGIPSKLVQQVMRTLLAAHLVVEVSGVETGYSPARPLEAINCHHILVAMRATHGQEPATRDEPVRVEVLGEFARIQAAEEHAAAAVTMRALVNRAQARLELAGAPATPKAINVSANVTAVDAPMFVSAAIATTPSVSFPEPAVAPPPSPIRPEPQPIEVASELPRKPAPSLSPATPTAATAGDDNERFPL
jgi:membrane protein